MPRLSNEAGVTDNIAHGTELMPPCLASYTSLGSGLCQTPCLSSYVLFQHHHKGKKHSMVIPATQGSEMGHQHPAEAQVMVLHYHKGPPLSAAPSALAERSSDRGTAKLGHGMTLSTRGIKGDFLFTLAIFTSQKRVLGEQPSPKALLRARMPAIRHRLYQHSLVCTQLAAAQGLKMTAQPCPASSTRMTFPTGRTSSTSSHWRVSPRGAVRRD